MSDATRGSAQYAPASVAKPSKPATQLKWSLVADSVVPDGVCDSGEAKRSLSGAVQPKKSLPVATCPSSSVAVTLAVKVSPSGVSA